jgi:hypothetical protein
MFRICIVIGIVAYCSVSFGQCYVPLARTCNAVPLDNPCAGGCAPANPWPVIVPPIGVVGDLCGVHVDFANAAYLWVENADPGQAGEDGYTSFNPKINCGTWYDCSCFPNPLGMLLPPTICLPDKFNLFNPGTGPWWQSQMVIDGDPCVGI